MQYNDFHGEKISALGFGLMRLPVIGGDQSNPDYDKVEEMVKFAVENGINYFDTAYPYHNGSSEKVLGRIMEEDRLRDRMLVATKLFTLGMDRPEFDPQKMLEEQLRRLRTDHIDFYLLHGLHGTQWETLRDKFRIREYLGDLKRQGIIRHIGFSFHDEYEKFVSIMDDYDGWEFAQIQYNYVDKDLQAGDRGMAYAAKKGIKISIMEPVKGGSLIFADYPEIDAIRARYGLQDLSCVELALRYVLDKPNLLTVLSGMGSMEMLRENIRIADHPKEGMLTEDMLAAIGEICAELEHSEKIDCTGCRYCTQDCPMQIQIPVAFSLYNAAKKFRSPDSQRRSYERACSNLQDCVGCGQCVEACPQHLDIPELLKQVRTYME